MISHLPINDSNDMSSDLTAMENDLRALAAAPLDGDFLERLVACAEGAGVALTSSQVRYESALQTIRPAPLPAELQADLEATVRGLAFAVDEKILLFPKSGGVHHPAKRRPLWAAAAAVALIGGASALLLPQAGSHSAKVARQPVEMPPAPGRSVVADPSDVVPASFNRGVSAVSDEGIVWKGRTQPHTVLKVVYKDMITLKDNKGRTFQIERPRVQYMLVPAKTD